MKLKRPTGVRARQLERPLKKIEELRSERQLTGAQLSRLTRQQLASGRGVLPRKSHCAELCAHRGRKEDNSEI